MKPRLLIVSAMVLWTYNFLASPGVYARLRPEYVMTLRLVVAVVAMELFLGCAGRRLGLPTTRLGRGDLGRIAGLALLQPFLYFVGESHGLAHVSASVGAVVIATIPVVFPLVALLVVRERVGIADLGLILLSFAGLVAVVVDPRDVSLHHSPFGLGMLALAVVAACLYVLAAKAMLARIDGVTLVRFQNLFGAAYFAVYAAASYRVLGHRVGLADLDAATWGHLVALGALASCLAFVLYSFALSSLRPWEANLYDNLIPVLTLGISVLFLGERVTPLQGGGIALVVATVAAAGVRATGERAEPAPTRR